MLKYPIEIGADALQKLQQYLFKSRYSQIMVLVDNNTHEHCYPILKPYLPEHQLCEVPAGEIHKNIETCTHIWQKLTDCSFDRKGLMINLGGGVIGDMGGFAAGTYKRGIDFMQVPTTLLSQVDASVGGKLGIDFQEYKNHIGLFKDPNGVYIYADFLKTLSNRELLSGFAEVIKHHLIADRDRWGSLARTTDVRQLDFDEIIQHSVDIKADIVRIDPFERGARKALNFGHTIGHAIESHLLKTDRPLLHGEAIAIGMIAEAHISYQRKLLSELELQQLTGFFLKHYPKATIPKEALHAIFYRMKNDKKNIAGQIMCTLLKGIGTFVVNVPIDEVEVMEAMDYYEQFRIN